MKNFLSLILFLFIFSGYLSAQNSAKLLDEFGPLNLDDMLGRLDAFAVEAQSDATARLLIRIENGTIDSFSAPFFSGAMMKAYLTNDRKLPSERVLVQYCDVGKNDYEIRRQLFVIPAGTDVEKCDESLFVPQKTKYFGSETNDKSYPKFFTEIEGCCEITGAGEAVTKISDEVLLELLSKSPDSTIYLIGYAGHFSWSDGKANKKGEWIESSKTQTDSLKVVDKFLKENKQRLVKKGIDPSGIVTVKGGYQKNWSGTEIYFVPKNGEIPKPKPDYFPKKKRK